MGLLLVVALRTGCLYHVYLNGFVSVLALLLGYTVDVSHHPPRKPSGSPNSTGGQFASSPTANDPISRIMKLKDQDERFANIGKVHGEDEGEARRRCLAEGERELQAPVHETLQELQDIAQANKNLDIAYKKKSLGNGRYGRYGYRQEALEAGYEDGRAAAIDDTKNHSLCQQNGTSKWLRSYENWLDGELYYSAIKPKKNFDPKRYKKGYEKGYTTYTGHVPPDPSDSKALVGELAKELDNLMAT